MLRCSADENPEIFAAARVGLGALGVIATVTLQCEPAYALAAAEAPGSLDEVLDELDENLTGNDHFEFYWFPHTRRVLDQAQQPRAARQPSCARSAACATGSTTTCCRTGSSTASTG